MSNIHMREARYIERLQYVSYVTIGQLYFILSICLVY